MTDSEFRKRFRALWRDIRAIEGADAVAKKLGEMSALVGDSDPCFSMALSDIANLIERGTRTPLGASWD